MFPIKFIEDLKDLNELASLQNQVQTIRLQNKLGKQKFHEAITKSFNSVYEEVTKTITETSENNNKALENLNDKLLKIMNDRGILASCLMSPLSKIPNLENSTHFELLKDHSSNRVNDLLKHNSIRLSLHYFFVDFLDPGKKFELKEDLLKVITNKNYNVGLASLSDKKLMYNFAEEMNFDVKAQGRKSTPDSTLIKLFKSPGLMVSASGVSKHYIYHMVLFNFVKD